MNVRMMQPQGPMGQPMQQGRAPAPMGQMGPMGPMGGPPPPMPPQPSNQDKGLGSAFGGNAAGRGQFRQFMSSKKQMAPQMQVPQMPMAPPMPQSPMLPPPMPTNMGIMRPMSAPNMGGAPQLGRALRGTEGGIGSAPVQMNMGGAVPRETEIMGQPHMLAYINPEEENMLQDYRQDAPTVPGPGGIPSYMYGQGMASTAGNKTFEVSKPQKQTSNNNNDKDERRAAAARAQQAAARQAALNAVFDDNDYTPTAAELNAELAANDQVNLTDPQYAETVDYSVTGSGQDYTTAAQADTDVSGAEYVANINSNTGINTIDTLGSDEDRPLNALDYSMTEEGRAIPQDQLIAEARAAGQEYYALNGNYERVPVETSVGYGEGQVDPSLAGAITDDSDYVYDPSSATITLDPIVSEGTGTSTGSDTGSGYMMDDAVEEFYNQDTTGQGGTDTGGDTGGETLEVFEPAPVYYDMFGREHSTQESANAEDKSYTDSQQSAVNTASQSDGQTGYRFDQGANIGDEYDIDTGPTQYEVDASNNTARLMNDYSAISDDFSNFQGADLTTEDGYTIGYATSGDKAGYSAVINPSTGGIDIQDDRGISLREFPATELEKALNFLTDGDINLSMLDAPLDLLPEYSGGTGTVGLDSEGRLIEYGTDTSTDTATDDGSTIEADIAATLMPRETFGDVVLDGGTDADSMDIMTTGDGLSDYEREVFGTDTASFYNDLANTGTGGTQTSIPTDDEINGSSTVSTASTSGTADATGTEAYLSAVNKISAEGYDPNQKGNLTNAEQQALYGARGQTPNAAESKYLQSLLSDATHKEDGPIGVNGQPMYKAGEKVTVQSFGETLEDGIVSFVDTFLNPLSFLGDKFTIGGANKAYVEKQLEAYKNGGTFVYGDNGATVVGVAEPNFDASGDGNNDTVVLFDESGNKTVTGDGIAVTDVRASNDNTDGEEFDIDIVNSTKTYENTKDGVVEEFAANFEEEEGEDDNNFIICEEGFEFDPVEGICMPIAGAVESGGTNISIGDVNRPSSGGSYTSVPSNVTGLNITKPKQFNRGGMVTPNINRFVQSLGM